MARSAGIVAGLVVASCSAVPAPPTAGIEFAAHLELVDQPSFEGRTLDATDPEVRFERITTAVPWPRGLVYHEGQLYVLARGRHRRSGGCDPGIADQAGSLFQVDPAVCEPVVIGRPPSAPVLANARLLAEPEADPFYLWDKQAPPIEDVWMDRPYCTLAFDAESDNFFICGFSGVDLPKGKFRKNATDSIHRYDRRDGHWYGVEMHRADVVPPDRLSRVVSNEYYPHHDPAANPPPHGWLNGPDGAEVAGKWLYAVGKDNHSLVQYDLSRIREDSEAPPPPSRMVFGSEVTVRVEGQLQPMSVFGHSALAVREDHLYVGFRTSSVVLRFPLAEDGDLQRPIQGELIAVFEAWDPAARRSGNLIDMAFNSRGELFVACAEAGRVWKVGIPDPDLIFDGHDARRTGSTRALPYLDLPTLTGNPIARVGNIVFDEQDRLYVCSGNYDTSNDLAGVIYRATSS